MTPIEAWSLQSFVFLVFILVVGVILVGAIIVFAMMRAVEFRRRQDREWQRHRLSVAETPKALGVCPACGRVFSDIRHLPGGIKRCTDCLESPDSPATPDQL